MLEPSCENGNSTCILPRNIKDKREMPTAIIQEAPKLSPDETLHLVPLASFSLLSTQERRFTGSLIKPFPAHLLRALSPRFRQESCGLRTH